MNNDNSPFTLAFQQTRIRVQRHTIQNTFVYHILFEDKRPPLVITRALNDNATHWWTSIPEGRQDEANETGALISQHLQQSS